jgi:hypothetical protein
MLANAVIHLVIGLAIASLVSSAAAGACRAGKRQRWQSSGDPNTT